MKKKKINYKDILIRMLKTFIQAAFAAFLLGTDNFSRLDKTVLKSAGIGALAAGLSAVMNLILNMLKGSEE